VSDGELSVLSAAEIIRLLDLSPHPEGGYFRESFRDSQPNGGRKHSTAIYYLLGAWTLAGCTVAPAFEFSKFEMAPKNFVPD
jgi:predicted cupin superfamily sugar epimerase